MRALLASLKWLGLFLLLSVIAIVLFPLSPILLDKTSSGAARAYLDEHAVLLDLEATDSGFVLPPDFYGRRLITLHEVHGFADVQALDWALMRHLHTEAGWRIYLGEFSPAQAIAFNEYVLGGSDAPARAVFDRWAEQAAQWGNQEFFDKLTAIRAFNETQRPERKIVFLGVDVLSSDEDAMESEITPATPPSFASTQNIAAINFMLFEQARARTPETRYGEILTNIGTVLDLPGAERARFYGLWGQLHGSQVETAGTKPLAMHFGEEGGLFEGEMATISTLCIADCFNLMPSAALPEPVRGPAGEPYTIVPMSLDNPYFIRVRGFDDVSDALGDARSLFLPLREERSPYAKGSKLLEQTGLLSLLVSLEYEGSAADAFDAMIIHQGSEPVSPWAGEVYDVRDPQ